MDDKRRCGECKKFVDSFVFCDMCGMVLCDECQNITENDVFLCSACLYDREV